MSLRNKKIYYIVVLIVIIVIAVFSYERHKKVQSEKQMAICKELIYAESDSLQWEVDTIINGNGNGIYKNVSIKAPFRIRYSYRDKDNSGLRIHVEKDGTLVPNPLMLCTGTEQNVSMQYQSLDSVNLKIDTKGTWAMAIETLEREKYPSVSLKNKIDSLSEAGIVDTNRIQEYIDSALVIRAQNSFKEKPDFNDLDTRIDEIIESSMVWHAITSDRGLGESESMDFYLPACKVKVRAGICPSSGMSFNGGLSLEGKGKTQSWDVIPSAWHMRKSWLVETRIVSVPAGYYWIDVSADGYYFYEVSALY